MSDDSGTLENPIVGILVIGNEVLDGIVPDSNSNWMERRLTALGISACRVTVVRDEVDEILQGLKYLTSVCSVVLTTGGLGPTHDDMTLKAVAEHCGVPLSEHPEAARIVKRQYQMLYKKGIVESPEYIDSRKKMAIIPEGASPLDNTVGGAPGVVARCGKTSIICLPGVPAELKYIFDDSVVQILSAGLSGRYYEKVVRMEARDESVFASHIDVTMRQHQGVYIKSLPEQYGKTTMLRVWLSARGESTDVARSMVEAAVTTLSRVAGLQPEEVAG